VFPSPLKERGRLWERGFAPLKHSVMLNLGLTRWQIYDTRDKKAKYLSYIVLQTYYTFWLNVTQQKDVLLSLSPRMP